jgi:hypothetical protein
LGLQPNDICFSSNNRVTKSGKTRVKMRKQEQPQKEKTPILLEVLTKLVLV